MKHGEALLPGEVKSLLLVDDDEAVLKVTRRSLERRGYHVVACSSGEEALSQLTRATFDCMISDVQMPGINGLRLLRAVRDRDLDIPVVLMTGNPDVSSAAAAVEYGAHQYLIKPIANDRLGEVVERAVNTGKIARLKREFVEQCGSGVFMVGDRASIDAALERALASLWMAFQPIVHVGDGSVFAQEALLRSEEPALPHPGAVLEAATRAQRLYDVGRVVRDSVAETISAAPDDWQFFVNVQPEDLSDPSLYLENAPLSLVAARVVLEITERVSLETMPGVQAQVAELRSMGFRVALDDLGAGYAGLTSFVRLEPEFVKLDMSLIRDVHRSDAKQKIIGSMVNLCHDMGKQIIAEGVEEAAERDTLVQLGCDFLQGYFFAKPARLSFEQQHAWVAR
jgi:EAL domain-containing protein (putative c-di-GMP-specific phosphodiesterase class I)/ActR/RegA family two-component response regulator